MLNSIYSKMPKKFFLVGVINTIFGYSVGILNYFLFFELIGIISVGIINNIMAITFAFILLKMEKLGIEAQSLFQNLVFKYQ